MELDFSLAARRSQEILASLLANLPNYVLAVAVFLLLLLVGRLVVKQVRRAVARTGAPYGLQSLLGALTRIGLGLIGLMLALGILGVDAAAIVAGAGVAGLVIGIAFKDILENFMAGILLLLRQPFTVGDRIVTNAVEGTVVEINLRSTVLKTYDGEQARVPNGAVLRVPLINKTAYPVTRTVIPLSIPSGEDVSRALEIVERVVREVADVKDDPAPDVAVVDFSEGTVTLDLRYWTDSLGATVNRVSLEMRLRLKTAFDEAGIELAPPGRALLVKGSTPAERTDVGDLQPAR